MEIQDIKTQISIGLILDHYGMEADKNQRMRCPFHDDKTPSMQIYTKTNTAYCFSSNCRTHGKSLDVIDFIMYKESITKHEAIEKAKTMINGQLRGNNRRTLTIAIFQYLKQCQPQIIVKRH